MGQGNYYCCQCKTYTSELCRQGHGFYRAYILVAYTINKSIDKLYYQVRTNSMKESNAHVKRIACNGAGWLLRGAGQASVRNTYLREDQNEMRR